MSGYFFELKQYNGNYRLINVTDGVVDTIPVPQGAEYEIVDFDTGLAPEGLKAERHGNDLYLIQSGEESPEIILENYYNNQATILGRTADNSFINYGTGEVVYDTTSTTVTHALAEEVSPILTAQSSITPGILAGVVALGGIAAVVGSGGGDSNDSNSENEHKDGHKATVKGDLSGNVTEDDVKASTIKGSISITGADPKDVSTFLDVKLNGKYGNFILKDGNWSYALDNSREATQALVEGEKAEEVFTLTATDGTQQNITINVMGMNDKAVVSGDFVGSVAEDNPEANTVTGSISITDADADDSPAFENVSLNGKYGSFILTDGNWSYALDNSREATQALAEGEKAEEVFTLTATDGTAQDVTVSVMGSDDKAVISGDDSGVVFIAEDNASVLTGRISISDIDGDTGFSSSTFNGQYGTLSIDTEEGEWMYQANANLISKRVTNDVVRVTAEDDSHIDIGITLIKAPDFEALDEETITYATTRVDAREDIFEGAREQKWGEKGVVLQSGSKAGFTENGDGLILKIIGNEATVDTGLGIKDAKDAMLDHDSVILMQGLNKNGTLETGFGNDFVRIGEATYDAAGNAVDGMFDTSQVNMGGGEDYLILGNIKSGAMANMGAGDDKIVFTRPIDYLMKGTLDGGDGVDTLVLDSAGDVSLNSVAEHVNNVEILDLRNGQENTLNITADALQSINDALIKSQTDSNTPTDIDSLLQSADKVIYSESLLSHLLHINADTDDTVVLFDPASWQKMDITHSTLDVFYRSANAEGDISPLESQDDSDEPIDHAKPQSDAQNYTLYQYTDAGDGSHQYLFIEESLNIL